jgi:flagellin-like protein
MQVRKLLKEDDAVSPVIGVILMVAITVILAAVIASFVLGLGDQASQTTPQASMSWDYSGDTYNVKVTHDGGDSIKQVELFVRGDGFNDSYDHDPNGAGAALSGDGPDMDGGASSTTSAEGPGEWPGDTSGEKGDDSAVVAGDNAVIHVDSDYSLRIVYQAQSGDNSATLAQDEGPDA